jgi:hypothetical protein
MTRNEEPSRAADQLDVVIGIVAQQTAQRRDQLAMFGKALYLRSTGIFIDIVIVTFVQVPYSAAKRINRDNISHAPCSLLRPRSAW